VTDDAGALYLAAIGERETLAGFSGEGPRGAGAARAVELGGGFSAVVAAVPVSMFSGAEADERMKDVGWVSERVREHDALVQRAVSHADARGGTVMPVGFGSVFGSVGAIDEALGGRGDEVRAYLREAVGCSEWSLKAWVDREAAIADEVASLASEWGVGGESGAGYLMRRKLEEAATERVEDRALAAVDGVLEAVDGAVVSAVEREVRDDGGAGGWCVAHVALLVQASERARFDALLDGAAEGVEGVSFELSGAWPCYSFCPRLGEEEAPAGVGCAA
jgi:hypothetical protein